MSAYKTLAEKAFDHYRSSGQLSALSDDEVRIIANHCWPSEVSNGSVTVITAMERSPMTEPPKAEGELNNDGLAELSEAEDRIFALSWGVRK